MFKLDKNVWVLKQKNVVGFEQNFENTYILVDSCNIVGI